MVGMNVKYSPDDQTLLGKLDKCDCAVYLKKNTPPVNKATQSDSTSIIKPIVENPAEKTQPKTLNIPPQKILWYKPDDNSADPLNPKYDSMFYAYDVIYGRVLLNEGIFRGLYSLNLLIDDLHKSVMSIFMQESGRMATIVVGPKYGDEKQAGSKWGELFGELSVGVHKIHVQFLSSLKSDSDTKVLAEGEFNILITSEYFDADTAKMVIKKMRAEINKRIPVIQQKYEYLKKNDPLFEPKSQFETEEQYYQRCIAGTGKMDSIYVNEVGPFCKRIKDIKGRNFYSPDIEIILFEYDFVRAAFPIDVIYQKNVNDRLSSQIQLEVEDAKLFYSNWKKMKKQAVFKINDVDEPSFCGYHISDTTIATPKIYEDLIFSFKERTESQRRLIYQAEDGKCQFEQEKYHNLIAIANTKFNKQFRELIVDNIDIINLANGKNISKVKCGESYLVEGAPIRGNYTKTGKYLILFRHYIIRVYDVKTAKEVASFKVDDKITNLAISDNDNIFAIGFRNIQYPRKDYITVFDIGRQKSFFSKEIPSLEEVWFANHSKDLMVKDYHEYPYAVY